MMIRSIQEMFTTFTPCQGLNKCLGVMRLLLTLGFNAQINNAHWDPQTSFIFSLFPSLIVVVDSLLILVAFIY